MNEGAFRKANEGLEQSARQILPSGDDGALVPFLCECPRPECTEVVLMTLEEYAVVRGAGERGMATLGHEDPSIENVVARNDRFVTTEKFGAAGEIHAGSDSRK